MHSRTPHRRAPIAFMWVDAKETTDFWIRFADTPDLEPATDIADWGERGRYVYDALTSTAKASQADVVAGLEVAGAE